MNKTIDFDELINQAKLIDEIANGITGEAVQRITAVYEAVDTEWSSASTQIYLKYMSEIREALVKKAAYLKYSVQFVKNAAKSGKGSLDSKS